MNVRLSRRQLLGAGALLLATARPGRTQPAGKVYRVGILGSTSPKAHGPFADAFRAGMRDLGYVEGKNVVYEFRWAEGDYSRLPGLAEELVRANVDVILTHGTPGSRAAKDATTAIPIVIAITGDAVATGLVQSFARPGGNITGSSFSFPEVNAKRLELLKDAFPGLKRVAVLMNAGNQGNVVSFELMTRLARTLNLAIAQVLARSPEDFEAAFAQVPRVRGEALSVYEDALFIAQAPRLAAMAEQHRLRSVGFREYAEAGGLLGFGVNFPDVWRRAAGFVDRIFKGARPGDLPMEQPVKYDTVVNLRTAKALRVTISPKVRLRADTVIE